MLIEFNTFQKHSADSKLYTNTYLMSVAAVQHSLQFDIVYIWISKFNASLVKYLSFYFNINIVTFVGFQIAVHAYVVLRTFTYTRPSSPS